MHTTPGCDLNEMVHMVAGLDALREETGADIKVAINHDVNGEPWTLGQVMLDSGVDFYLTGINIHFGGIPFARPASFLWEQSDGRKLRSFIGEHYSLFSQFMFTQEHSTERMQEGVEEYVTRLTKNGYQKDFAFLTATNPPLYDNNCPDLELPDLIRKYNEEGQDIVLQDIDKATKRNVKVIQKNLSKIDGKFIRHDSEIIASSIMELICNDLKFRDKESTPQYLLINSILEDELKRERKETARIRKQKKKIENSKRKSLKKKSKFNSKYSERMESIQTTVEKKNENQKLYKEMEKLDK